MEVDLVLTLQQPRTLPSWSISTRWNRNHATTTYPDFLANTLVWVERCERIKHCNKLRQVEIDLLATRFRTLKCFEWWKHKHQVRQLIRGLLLRMEVRRHWRCWKLSTKNALLLSHVLTRWQYRIIPRLRLGLAWKRLQAWTAFGRSIERFIKISITAQYKIAVETWVQYVTYERAKEWHRSMFLARTLKQWKSYAEVARMLERCEKLRQKVLCAHAFECLSKNTVVSNQVMRTWFHCWVSWMTNQQIICGRAAHTLSRYCKKCAWTQWQIAIHQQQQESNEPKQSLIRRARKVPLRQPCGFVNRYYRASISKENAGTRTEKKKKKKSKPVAARKQIKGRKYTCEDSNSLHVVVKRKPRKQRHDSVDETLSMRLNDAYFLLGTELDDAVWHQDDVLSKSFHRNTMHKARSKNQANVKLSYWF